MQAWRMRVLLVAIIVLLPFEIVLLVALWPYLPIVGKAIAGLLVTCCICGAITVCAWTWQRIRAPHVIVAGDVVVMLTKTGYEHLSAKHEAAKLALPAPRMTITEEKADGYSPGDLEILAMISQGKSQEVVAKACGTNQTYVSRLVRRYKEQHNMVD